MVTHYILELELSQSGGGWILDTYLDALFPKLEDSLATNHLSKNTKKDNNLWSMRAHAGLDSQKEF